MTGFFNALSASAVLLLLMSLGYLLGRLGWLGGGEKRFLSKFIINIAVPCNCVVGLLDNLDRAMLGQAGWMLLCALLSVGATLLLSMGLATLLRLPRERWGLFAAMTGLSNVLFIGLPVCTQLFGDACVPFVMVYYLANTTYLQSAGLLLVEHGGTTRGKTTVAGFFKDVFTKPPILAVLAAVALLALDLRPPAVAMRFAGYVADTVSPLALIYCGYILYEVGLKNLRLMRGMPTMLLVRLGVAPAICWVFCHLFGMGGLPMNVFVVESALPVVSQVTVMAGAFGADEQYAAVGSCLSVLGGLISIPILMLVLG